MDLLEIHSNFPNPQDLRVLFAKEGRMWQFQKKKKCLEYPIHLCELRIYQRPRN